MKFRQRVIEISMKCITISTNQAEVFIRVIEPVLDGCHSIQLYFGSIIFRMRVTAGHTRIRSVSHGSIEDQLFELSS